MTSNKSRSFKFGNLWFHLFFILNLNQKLSFCNGKTVLQSPMLTDWGDWGVVDNCPNGTYVVGMQVKVESKQPPLHDDTALNGVRFFCSDLSGESQDDKVKQSTIQSTVGPWGTWRSEFMCQNGVVLGFQLRSEPEQRKHDDTAANNLRIICSDGQIIEGEGTDWGEWTPEQKCRKRQAICSIQTQVEMTQGAHDDTALNNLRVNCCNIPNPSEHCMPTDFWELVAECDNTNAFTPTTCSYERKIGLGYSTGQSTPAMNSNTNNHERSILENLGFSLGIEASVLSQKFQFETSIGGKTGYNWGASKTDTWNHETSTKVSFDVPPGVRSSMVQVVGACGLYLVRTSKFQRIDMVGMSSPSTGEGGAMPQSSSTMSP